MILIKPSAKIIALSKAPLLLIEEAGRTCYKSEDKIKPESAIPFAEMILRIGHESVLEHASASVRFICDRGVSHELVRHRLASFSQESTRYCDYNKDQVTFIIPYWCDIEEGVYKNEDCFDRTSSAYFDMPQNSIQWFEAMINAEYSYKSLRQQGWKPEQARSVLPNSLKTEIVVTANFREWRLIFKQRTSPKAHPQMRELMVAHPQMRELMVPLLEEFKKYVPVIFDGINS